VDPDKAALMAFSGSSPTIERTSILRGHEENGEVADFED
jgi:hypothetical protein